MKRAVQVIAASVIVFIVVLAVLIAGFSVGWPFNHELTLDWGRFFAVAGIVSGILALLMTSGFALQWAQDDDNK